MKITQISRRDKYYTFGAKKDNEGDVNSRIKHLKMQGLSSTYSNIIAQLNAEQYNRALVLINRNVEQSCVEEVSGLEKEKFEQALRLIQEGVNDSFLFQLSNMEKDCFSKALDYIKDGFDDDCLKIFAELNKTEKKKAVKLLKMGFSAFAAGNLSRLSPSRVQIAMHFMGMGVDVCNACEISKLSKENQKKCEKYLNLGIQPDFVADISQVSKKDEHRLPELFSLKVGDINIAELANLNKSDYRRAIELIKNGVDPDYIIDILDIERGSANNPEYEEYRQRGYSYTTSMALSLLDDEEIQAFEKLREIHPEIRDLMSQEYGIEVIDLQNNEDQDVIMTRKILSDNGTKIVLVRTYDSYGDSTKSRLEKYKDNSTTSFMESKSNIFKIKYDKFGEVNEMTEFLKEDDSISAVIQTKASKQLAGAFESTYYDISQFRVSNDIRPELIDKSIEQSVKSTGIPISKVSKKDDGSIEFIEDFQLNSFKTNRNYTEKKDENGKIISYSYQYIIENEDTQNVLMDINRSYIKQSENTALNTINGVDYKLQYDDVNRMIFISDGENEKTLDFKNKLPKYSDAIIWQAIRELPVDTLLTIYNNIKKWHYCEDVDSSFSTPRQILSTGTNLSVITHETGHIQSNENTSIFENDDLCQIYGHEMDTFMKNVPYNEQEFVQYFSPRADIENSDGLDEFIAETNILLSSYGTKYNKLKTRSFLLSRYFPQTIAKIADLTGKNSTQSLLV